MSDAQPAGTGGETRGAGSSGMPPERSERQDRAAEGSSPLEAGAGGPAPATSGAAGTPVPSAHTPAANVPAANVPAEASAEGGYRQHLLPDEELGDMVARWRNIQAEFVDEPKTAVADADALVSDLTRRLTEVLASERAALESRLTSAGELSTEDLRQGLRSYRSFFERLLAT